MTREPDLYAVLGVTRDATQDDINHAYRQLVRRHHPDFRHHPDSDGEDDPSAADSLATLERVLAAYAVLRDPARRAAYDRQHRPPPPPPRRSAKPDTKITIRVNPVRYHGPGTSGR